MTHLITEAPPHHEVRVKMSYEEWLTWAEDHTQAEWVNGEGIAFVPPKTVHMLLLEFLRWLLKGYVDLLNLGEVASAPFEMRLESVPSSREPDLLFIANAHRHRLTAERLVGPADLAIEIISDDSVTRDRRDKRREYAAAGVPEYWLLDPRPRQQRARFYRLNERGEYDEVFPSPDGRYHAQVVPGFWVRPEWFWQDPLPNPAPLLAMLAADALRAALKTADALRRAEAERA